MRFSWPRASSSARRSAPAARLDAAGHMASSHCPPPCTTGRVREELPSNAHCSPLRCSPLRGRADGAVPAEFSGCVPELRGSPRLGGRTPTPLLAKARWPHELRSASARLRSLPGEGWLAARAQLSRCSACSLPARTVRQLLSLLARTVGRCLACSLLARASGAARLCLDGGHARLRGSPSAWWQHMTLRGENRLRVLRCRRSCMIMHGYAEIVVLRLSHQVIGLGRLDRVLFDGTTGT
ncbi:hypothetical protein Dimus_035101 [Dionaea muscipula]